MSYDDEPPYDPGQALRDHITHFRRRIIQDAITEATAANWRRRAQDFDHVGTPDCDEIAQACRNHATILTDVGLDTTATAELDDILTRIGALK